MSCPCGEEVAYLNVELGDVLCLAHLQAYHRMKYPRCSCGRRLLLAHCAMTSTKRTVCAWCALGRPVGISMPAGDDVKIKVGKDWYRTGQCHHEGCAVKLVWLLPSGIVACKDHGAGAPLTKVDEAGRS